MKIALFFAKPRRAEARRTNRAVHAVDDWSTRQWADLPVHHPRRD